MEEFTRKYEYVDGAVIQRKFAGHQIPIPPEWVWRRSSVPKRAKNACLSKEIAHLFPEDVRPTLVQYVVDWPVSRTSGTDLILAGAVPIRRLQWAAAAVVNEIVMRYAPLSVLTTEWFSPGGLSWLLDARTSRADEYAPIRNQILNRKLLYVENPLAVGKGSEGMWFLRALYQHRYDKQLPTITSLPYSLYLEGWAGIKDVLGSDITDILRENHHDYLAHY